MSRIWDQYVVATYRVWDERADFEKKAQGIALGMTIGSWTDVPAAQKSSMEAHCGQVVKIQEYPAEQFGGRCADLAIAYPYVNLSMDFASIIVTIFGKLSMDGAIKLVDVHFPACMVEQFTGPRFGIQGVRDLLKVQERPLLMSIFKSVIGYDLQNFRDQFEQQIMGGVDLVKDDEILCENERTPIGKRVETCRKVIETLQASESRMALYAVNVSGTHDQVISRAREAVQAGANALLVNVLAYGYDLLQHLRQDVAVGVPILAHPAMAGAIYPAAQHGISAHVLLGKLMRLAGADLVLFPSPYGSVVMPLADNLAIRDACVTKKRGDYIYGAGGHLDVASAMPVPSAGIHPGLVARIIHDFGNDVVVNAGGGLFGHPLGTFAGGQAFVQAIAAVMDGLSLEEKAALSGNEALKVAIERWGVKK